MLDDAALIQKHLGKGVLVDANLLVLFLVGKVNRQRIRDFKRTQDFTIEDFDLLSRLIVWIGKLIATSRALVADPIFERLGLTDAAIATVCSRGILVLTADVALQLAVQQRGADALNFGHIRQIWWS